MTLPLINIRFILLISASFIAIFSSIAIYFCLPILISHVIRTQITLSPNSGSFNQWKTNSVLDRIYLFNITNLDELMSTSDGSTLPTTTPNPSSSTKRAVRTRPVPRLKEVGPFTYKQIRDKLHIKFDRLNETVSYDQRKSWYYMPELSVSKEIDSLNINHISVPLAGTTLNPEYAEFIDAIVTENDLRLFLKHSVGTLMFEGYYDILMEQAKASGQIDVERFGWMHNQNDSLTKAIRVFTGPSNATLNKFGLVDEFNNKKQFQIWHNNNSKPNEFNSAGCNHFRLSSAGEFFPPPEHSLISHDHLSHLYKNSPLESTNEEVETNRSLSRHHSKQPKSISLFMPELCRTIQLFYNGSHDHKGLLVDRYIANENTYKYWHSDGLNSEDEMDHINPNKCFCIYNETSHTVSCPPNGMMDLFQCRKGSPVTISFPHFLYSSNDATLDPFLRLFKMDENIDSRPNDYEFFVDLESTLNLPVNVQIVLQFNVHLRNDPQFNFTKEYAFLFEDPQADASSPRTSNDFYLPQMWIKSTAEIDDANLNNLIFIQKHLRLVTPLATIIIFGCASILLLASAKLAYDLTYGPKSRKSLANDELMESFSASNHNQDQLCSAYMNEKKKYLNMQLLAMDNNNMTTSTSTKAMASDYIDYCSDESKKSSKCKSALRLPFGNSDKDKTKQAPYTNCARDKSQQSFAINEPTTSKSAGPRFVGTSDSSSSSSASSAKKFPPTIQVVGEQYQRMEESQPLNDHK